MTDVEKLLAMEEIRNLKARYFRYVDSHDWAGFRSILADDIVFKSPVPPEQGASPGGAFTRSDDIVGADAAVAWVSGKLEHVRSAHVGYMPEIEILSPTEARAVWGMEDILRGPNVDLHGYGYYRETYSKESGTWKIKTWSLFYKSMEARNVSHTPFAII
jgi:hypothetical protein